MSHLTKTEMPLVMWLNSVTLFDRNVCLLFTHMREDVHATRQFCIVNDGLINAMPFEHAGDAASVHNTCLDKMLAIYKEYLTGNGNWNNKWVSELSTLKLGVCSKINACYIFVCIFSRCAKTWTSNFCKVVRQHTEGVVGTIVWILLEIYLAF